MGGNLCGNHIIVLGGENQMWKSQWKPSSAGAGTGSRRSHADTPYIISPQTDYWGGVEVSLKCALAHALGAVE